LEILENGTPITGKTSASRSSISWGTNENIDVRIKKKKSLIGRGKIEGQDVVLLKPQTFINLIGESVLYIASFLRINVKDIICIVEDSSLELGDMRVDYVLSKLEHEGVKSRKRCSSRSVSPRFAWAYRKSPEMSPWRIPAAGLYRR
jgi:peptidyl-tRNA hydrolase